ncbi:hypothetical protein GCM10010124_03200 [Pilimelia terevasa]|uniref:Secreted protein n=1 Tax=Pilimelia terevasa TaxID=53372 RepID=A0A8J3BIQ5_9ACTN|nr:DUF4360 domain-containing protein [Pilimelia terevasa]GGK13957.1 hypothetical protein GCM10010124_03200 [Pilimelia terevasa]
MLLHAVTSAVAAILAVAGPAWPVHPAADPPAGLQVTDVQFAGEGCLPWTASVVPALDGRSVEVVYGSFFAQAGAVPQVDGTTSWVPRQEVGCRASFTLTYDPGWRVALRGGDSYTFADIARGARGTVRAGHRWGTAPPADAARTVAGPLSDGVVLRHDTGGPLTDCGAPVPVVMRKDLIVEAGTAAANSLSELAADVKSLASHDRVHLRWERC